MTDERFPFKTAEDVPFGEGFDFGRPLTSTEERVLDRLLVEQRRMRAEALPADRHPSGNGAGGAGSAADEGTAASAVTIEVATLAEFVSVDEPGAAALVGDGEAVLIPEDGDVMFYGDGGAGKTTLAIDLAFHLAAGDDWLGIAITRPARVLLIENEGPRPLYRRKLRRKRDGWTGAPVDDRITVVESPWARLSFDKLACREALAGAIRECKADIAVVGPVARSGMHDAGTLQEVRDFMGLVAHARELSERRVAFVLIHHENKGGKVSGAWEGAGDTLFHVQGQGHGRTRLFVQKARWSSEHHATALNLVWADGDGFTVEEKRELDDETIAGLICDYVRENAATAWGPVRKAITGVGNGKLDEIRDALFARRRLVNVVNGEARYEVKPQKTAHLHLADDPAVAHLLDDPGTALAQSEPHQGGGGSAATVPCAPPLGGTGTGGADSPPSDELERLREKHADIAEGRP